ncbi:hypothetical protein GUJ93_ZPchr0013g35693 [Zizania palustris]|uniref:Bifunctional inhibitor/plant lipid transfer protein/seed storage helical domain-containing protein n=1 Tax=Zizania palustris TaxID=103762 RepID=A0A8J5WYT5_ZIZPA|nr:hypothetical protein GUJ93_ZPchr0013g35693 [Zizania palustris]
MRIKALACMVVVVAVLALASAPAPADGQAVAVSCTASLITSFTPCLNFITGNTNGGNGTGVGGAAPPADCCRSLAAVMSTSTSCACLILTGNVPLGIPINRTLAVTLPRACNSMSVPLQCRDKSSQIPNPGVPVAVSPAMPPLSPTPAELPESPESPTTTSPEPTPPPATSEGQTRPQVLQPSSASWRRASAPVPASVLLLAAMLF